MRPALAVMSRSKIATRVWEFSEWDEWKTTTTGTFADVVTAPCKP